MFKKILVANRGEIALRVLRACKEMGIATVAIHSTADSQSMHTRLADQSVCVGEHNARESYMNVPAILAACDITGAEAIHPGYGFLSENASFADIVTEHGVVFIGPTAEHIRTMGDKIAAKQKAKELGLPVVPGTDGRLETVEQAYEWADKIGYPVLIKASAGGGGRGMQVALTKADLETAFRTARSDAGNLYGDPSVYMEKYLLNPRHIEIQVIADSHGHALHLGERDCSLQRRHQKLVEEAPSPVIDADKRQEIGMLVAKAMQKMGYLGVGTIEFLYEDGQFYFIEMNTRIQVEHPVTEAVTGFDLIQEQIRIAAGLPLSFQQDDVKMQGHAIECRINAEDPFNFMPCAGKITELHTPGGLGVRVDSAAFAGYQIPPYYDSLIGKLIVHAPDRQACLMRLQRCLQEFVVSGVKTTIPLFEELLKNPDFQAGNYNIKWLETYLKERS